MWKIIPTGLFVVSLILAGWAYIVPSPETPLEGTLRTEKLQNCRPGATRDTQDGREIEFKCRLERTKEKPSLFPVKDAAQIIVTFLLLAATLFVILSSRYGPKDKHWAYATVGTLLGFWLKP